MFEISNLFQGVVEEAVHESLRTSKPLVVYNTEEENTNAWIKKWFRPRGNGNSISVDELKAAAVWLKLNKGTTQFEFFEQMFPQEGVVVPSVYVIKNGKLSTVIKGDDVEENWGTLVKSLNIVTDAPAPAPALAPSEEETHTSSVEPAELTFKESVNKKTMEIYQKEVQKERKLARLERERILRLVKADREERKARDLKLREQHKNHRETSNGGTRSITSETNSDALESVDTDTAVVEDVRDNFKNTEKLHTSECTLLIKLTNSESLTHTFNSKDQLNSVRSWVDSHRTDSDCPYMFHRSIPRVTFTEPDELKSLEELELTPRSVLIIKPLESSTRGHRLNVASSQVGQGLFGKVYNGLYSWWNGTGGDNNNGTGTTTTASGGSVNDNNTGFVEEDMQPLLSEDTSNDNRGQQSISRQNANNSSVRSQHAAEDNSNTSFRRSHGNFAQFHNTDDDRVDDDDEKDAYNGNSTNLEKNRDDH